MHVPSHTRRLADATTYVDLAVSPVKRKSSEFPVLDQLMFLGIPTKTALRLEKAANDSSRCANRTGWPV